MSHDTNGRPRGGRGFSLVLGLCAAALGIAGYGLSARQAPPAPTEQEREVLSTEQLPVQEPERVFSEVTEPPVTEPPKPQKLAVCRPLEGEILAGYCAECLGYNETTRDWRVHPGIDIGAPAGTAVKAAADGEVYTVYEDDQLGCTVVLRHEGGYMTRYASLAADPPVTPGQKVSMGDEIGTVGSTALMESALGDHVHFSVTKQDAVMDPEAFFAM